MELLFCNWSETHRILDFQLLVTEKTFGPKITILEAWNELELQFSELKKSVREENSQDEKQLSELIHKSFQRQVVNNANLTAIRFAYTDVDIL